MIRETSAYSLNYFPADVHEFSSIPAVIKNVWTECISRFYEKKKKEKNLDNFNCLVIVRWCWFIDEINVHRRKKNEKESARERKDTLTIYSTSKYIRNTIDEERKKMRERTKKKRRRKREAEEDKAILTNH